MEPPTGCLQSESWSHVCCCLGNNTVVSGERWRRVDACSRLPPACRPRGPRGPPAQAIWPTCSTGGWAASSSDRSASLELSA